MNAACEVRLTADLKGGDSSPTTSQCRSPSFPCPPDMKLTRRPVEIEETPASFFVVTEADLTCFNAVLCIKAIVYFQ